VAGTTTEHAGPGLAERGRDPSGDTNRGDVVRNNVATRLFHAGTVVVVGALLGTGWWLRTGHEGRPSLLADALGEPDTEIHRTAGWVLVGLAAAGLTLGARAAWTFARETARANRGDGRWFLRWPIGAVTGRMAPHRGHFDPGQRLLNVGIVASLGTLAVTGIAMTTLSGGPTFATMVRVHRGATYVLTGLVAGHLLVVSGVLRAYRGVWRAMVTGRVSRATARRLWPAEAPQDADAEGGDTGGSHA
jgi:cytochrome b subunit of formate dehydrogenase